VAREPIGPVVAADACTGPIAAIAAEPGSYLCCAPRDVAAEVRRVVQEGATMRTAR